eukprot:GHVR01056358.1.p1 GENE.GHVR01056358.1~~GHVR01056358.1.p1  ORF type:complete len:104 (-),score=6.46 GHVR01056358.1:6-317(-)
MKAAEVRGDYVIRMWGCDGGERPYPGWKGYSSPGAAIDLIHSDQEEAAKFIAPLVRARNAILSGAWATHDGSSGCVNSVVAALKRAGWPGSFSISRTALYEEF